MIVGIYPGPTGALFFLDPASPATGEAVDLPVHVLARGGCAKREIDVQSLVGLLSAVRQAIRSGILVTRGPTFPWPGSFWPSPGLASWAQLMGFCRAHGRLVWPVWLFADGTPGDDA
jgi:hypothetical protein